MSEAAERTFTTPHTERVPLTPESIREIWTKTYNTNGKPDWANIYPYYHPDIVFHDAIQRLEGMDDFVDMCERLASRCERLNFDIHDLAMDGNIIFMQWTMTMEFRRTPMTPMYGCTKLTLHEDGRILEQRDYYDIWGDILAKAPGLGKLYRAFMKKVFG
jgi:limonene-1,2-epoxide hydrolase